MNRHGESIISITGTTYILFDRTYQYQCLPEQDGRTIADVFEKANYRIPEGNRSSWYFDSIGDVISARKRLAYFYETCFEY